LKISAMGGGALSAGARADVKEKDRDGQVKFFVPERKFVPSWAREWLLY
jgi:hypothetical protein